MTTTNPFAVLGVTTRDDRARIMEAAEDRSDVIDPEMCSQARATLTNPRKRLEAELGWFPGTSPTIAEQILSTPMSDIDQLPLAGLVKANALTIASERWQPERPSEVQAFLDALCSAVDDIDLSAVLREVNEDREVAGFPVYLSNETAQHVLNDRRQQWRRAAMGALDKTLTNDMVEAMLMLIDRRRDQGRLTPFLHEIVSDYALRIQPFMTRERLGADRVIAKARELASKRPDALLPLIDCLGEIVETWEITRPVQISSADQGRDDDEGIAMALAIRSLAIDLNNKHQLTDEALRISNILQDGFASLPNIATLVENDMAALRKLKIEAAKQEKEMTYAADIGIFRKSRLGIDKTGVEWRGQRTQLGSIHGVRWGALRKSINGVHTGTDYLISWTDGRTRTSAEFQDEAVFTAFVPKLWNAVGIRLMAEMINELGAGRELRFGTIIARNDSVVLTKHKIFGSEPVQYGWRDVTVDAADGSFVIRGPRGSKADGSASYRQIDNVHFFEGIVRQAINGRKNRLSDAFVRT